MPKPSFFYYDKEPALVTKLAFMLSSLFMHKTDDEEIINKSIQQQIAPAKIPNSIEKKFDVSTQEFEGRPLWMLSPKKRQIKSTLLYLHGGAYSLNIMSIQWKMIETIVEDMGISLIVPDYPLTEPAKCVDVYAYLIKMMPKLHTFRAGLPWAIIGDSAGGGLAYGFTQYLRNNQQTLPKQLILLSPWLDVTMTNPKQKEIEKQDKLLSIKTLKITGKAYAGSLDTKDYRVSPLYGDLNNLPPTSIFTGTYDILNTDANALAQKLEQQDIAFNFYEYNKMLHVFMGAYFLKEAKIAIKQIRDLL